MNIRLEIEDEGMTYTGIHQISKIALATAYDPEQMIRLEIMNLLDRMKKDGLIVIKDTL